MELNEKYEMLCKIVTEMRAAQKRYFELRKRHIEAKPELEKSKLFETQVDKFLELQAKENAAKQVELFK